MVEEKTSAILRDTKLKVVVFSSPPHPRIWSLPAAIPHPQLLTPGNLWCPVSGGGPTHYLQTISKEWVCKDTWSSTVEMVKVKKTGGGGQNNTSVSRVHPCPMRVYGHFLHLCPSQFHPCLLHSCCSTGSHSIADLHLLLACPCYPKGFFPPFQGGHLGLSSVAQDRDLLPQNKWVVSNVPTKS